LGRKVGDIRHVGRGYGKPRQASTSFDTPVSCGTMQTLSACFTVRSVSLARESSSSYSSWCLVMVWIRPRVARRSSMLLVGCCCFAGVDCLRALSSSSVGRWKGCVEENLNLGLDLRIARAARGSE
jgi:hypothetical protein